MSDQKAGAGKGNKSTGRTAREPRMPPPSSGLNPAVGSLTRGGTAQSPPQQEDPKSTGAGTRTTTGASKRRQEDPPTTRSWYLPQSSADKLAAEIKRLYLDLEGEVPRYEVLGALVEVATEHHNEVKARLEERQRDAEQL